MGNCLITRCSHLAMVLLLASGLIFGCSGKPAEPKFDNPLDPDGILGDPFDVTAEVEGNTVLVEWTRPDRDDILFYRVLHSLDGTIFSAVGEVDAGLRFYVHQQPSPNTINYYKVQAKDAFENTTAVSLVAAAGVRTPPFLEIAGGAESTPTRLVPLSFKTIVGDSVLIADNAEFTGALRLPAEPGDVLVTVDWDLGPAASDRETKNVYLRSFSAGFTSQANRQTILADLDPGLQILDDPATVARQLIDLEMTGAPGDSMRFAASEAELSGLAWLPADTLFSGYLLSASAAPQRVYGQFLSDFGFSVIEQIDVVPDDLSGAGFAINDDDEFTYSPLVMIDSDATATQMRFAESPNFAGVPWLAYANTLTMTLSSGGGLKQVYGQFRNDWTGPVTRFDVIRLIDQPLLVAFTYPLQGAVVLGGLPLTITGYAIADPSVAALELVGVDLGDGDFEPASGLADWSFAWDVPRYKANTARTLRARAIAGADTATALISVTVTHLAITIAEPADGSAVSDTSTVDVSGTATGILGGAVLDSVTVFLDGAWRKASGTRTWHTSWEVPDVDATTQAVIRAKVFAADGATALDSVTVDIDDEG